MRTAIFLGLISIAEAIGRQTGWKVEGDMIKIAGLVLVTLAIMDLVEFPRNK